MSVNCFKTMSGVQEKHVTFAANPIIYNSIPWKIDHSLIQWQHSYDQSLDPYETDYTLKFTPLSNFAEELNFKSLKVPYHVNKESPNIIGLIIIIICLISLFVLIWWIADKLLILEIEKQVSKVPIKSTNGHLNTLR
ncbi:hypothetical protein M9Y10_037295 [Tritrichomonas musculus]|uniref:Uncharacterized protein n=1 Tax=Tritrichomonas musculus TaxID=1915356 RepID=A0ABR2GS57_9EUKA